MVGPSSSHTAGAARVASMVRSLLASEPARVDFTLYGSFSHTDRGHGTDRALVAGKLGLAADDLAIRNSIELAGERGLAFSFALDQKTRTPHPNTVDIRVEDAHGSVIEARGVSIGGGAAELTRIDGVDVAITGEFNSMIVYQEDSPGVLAHISNRLSERHVNIGTVAMHRTAKGGTAFTVLEIDDLVPADALDEICAHPAIKSVRFVAADGIARPEETLAPPAFPLDAQDTFDALDFTCGSDLLERCERRDETIGEAFFACERALMKSRMEAPEELAAYLTRILAVMRASATEPARHPVPSMGGLIGGEAAAVTALETEGAGLGPSGRLFARSTAYALAVLETNASMGRIVAAPTAGSSGVLPAVLFALQDERGFTDEQLENAVANAAAIGCIISRNATVSGAEGGCQAEIGSASAMAASAAVELLGGSPRACLNAAGLAIANLLGLVCDPVGGLVETPCQVRNASAAANALVSAQAALAGIASPAPFDEVVDALYRVGRSMPVELRETALGGLAACPSCRKAPPTVD